MNLNRWNTSRHCLLAVLCLFITACSGGAPSGGADTALGSTSSALTSSSVPTGSLSLSRTGHKSLLLKSGKVLVLGGYNQDPTTNAYVYHGQMELYDPATGTWTSAGTMHPNIAGSSATVLPSGKVLFAGRKDPGGPNGYGIHFNQALLYDPADGSWTPTGNMLQPRGDHQAILLSSGKVFVLGGSTTNGFYLHTAEIYDPATGTWSSAGTMPQNAHQPTFIELPTGHVLVTGGNSWSSVAHVQRYDLASNSWSLLNPMAHARESHQMALLPSGRVLVAGGVSRDPYWGDLVLSSEIYDPATGTWSPSGNVTAFTQRSGAAYTLLSGHVVIIGESQVQVYDPSTGTWEATGALSTERSASARVMLGSGRILVSGGHRYDTATGKNVYYSSAELVTFPSWNPGPNMSSARGSHTLTLLTTGRALVAGGFNGATTTATAELYTPSTGTWLSTGNMVSPRESHTATVLASGRVLVAGGAHSNGTVYDTAEQYDANVGRWTALAGRMLSPRQQHTAVRLGSSGNNKVLVVGGFDGFNYLATAETYDSTTGTWSAAGSMSTPRYHHTAVMLPSGRVLVTGGFNGATTLASAELYDPATNTWSPAAPMSEAREGHTAVVLNNGRVLVSGGGANAWLSTAELYDPATNTWTSTGSMTSPREGHTATLLASGDVLAVGGFGGFDYLYTAELYSPATGTWKATLNMASLRYAHQALRLATGDVLAVGGYGDMGPLNTVDLYRP